MLEEDIAPVLARLDAWYAAHLPPDRYRFNPPASEAQLDAFERLIGIKLPNSYRQLYRWHDGDAVEGPTDGGHIYDFPILSLRAAADEWKAWNDVLADPETFRGNRYWSIDGVQMYGAGWPQGAVDPAYINPRWIPLTIDGSGNDIGLDFDPWPGGRIGQVIIHGRDEDVKVVLAESLGKFLGWIAGLLESGNFQLEDAGLQRPPRFRLKTPRTGNFMTGARILLGAPDEFLSNGEFTYTLAARAARGEDLGG